MINHIFCLCTFWLFSGTILIFTKVKTIFRFKIFPNRVKVSSHWLSSFGRWFTRVGQNWTNGCIRCESWWRLIINIDETINDAEGRRATKNWNAGEKIIACIAIARISLKRRMSWRSLKARNGVTNEMVLLLQLFKKSMPNSCSIINIFN